MVFDTKDKNLTKEALYELGIFQLRSLARSIGVHLPTTLKKEELIEQILMVSSGQQAPFVPKNKKGRPAKGLADFSSAWAKQESSENGVKAMNSWENGKFIESSGFSASFGVSAPKSIFNETDTTNAFKATGVAFCEANGYVTLHLGGLTKLGQNDIAYISPQMALDFLIKTGDEVECLVNPKTNSVCKVLFVNGREIGHLNCFDKLHPIKPQPIVELFKKDELNFTKFLCPIGRGQRVLIRGERGSGKTELLKNMANGFALCNMHTIFVSLDKRPEDKLTFENSNIEYVFASFDTIPFRQMYMLELAVAKAKRMCEENKDVVLLIDDLMACVRAYDFCLAKANKTDFSGYDVNAVIAVKKLLAAGINAKEGGSVTLIGAMPCGVDGDDLRFVLTLDDVCNAHIILDKTLYKIGAKTYVSYQSQTDNENDLIGKEEMLKAADFRTQCKGKAYSEIERLYQKYFE